MKMLDRLTVIGGLYGCGSMKFEFEFLLLCGALEVAVALQQSTQTDSIDSIEFRRS